MAQYFTQGLQAEDLLVWEGILFLIQIIGFLMIVYWSIRDEKLGGKANTGFFAAQDTRKPAAISRPGDRQSLLRGRHLRR
jgi:hypothetical protein